MKLTRGKGGGLASGSMKKEKSSLELFLCTCAVQHASLATSMIANVAGAVPGRSNPPMAPQLEAPAKA